MARLMRIALELAFVLLVALPLEAAAQSPPPLPHFFYGAVQVRSIPAGANSDAPEGTVVSALESVKDQMLCGTSKILAPHNSGRSPISRPGGPGYGNPRPRSSNKIIPAPLFSGLERGRGGHAEGEQTEEHEEEPAPAK